MDHAMDKDDQRINDEDYNQVDDNRWWHMYVFLLYIYY